MSAQVKTIHVLYLITDLNFGGAQKVLSDMLKRLDKNRFMPTVACLFGGDGPVADEIRAIDIPVVDLGMIAKWRLDALVRLFLLLRRMRPVILHASLFHANIPGRVFGRLAGVPIIITWRQNVNIGGQIRELINRWTAELGDRTVAVSDLVLQVEIKRARISPDKVVTIYNGIDVSAFATPNPEVAAQIRQSFDIPPGTLLVGTVGRLHPQKGLDNLLTAMPIIKRQFPNLRLLIIGDGELRNSSEIQAQSLGISDDVIFTGPRTDVPEIIPTLDVFSLPSLWEGLSLALLEAMAAGLPVVATSVGGTPEVVVDGATGLLVPPRDPTALAEAITHILTNPSMAHRMGQAGRERVTKHFSIDETVRKTEQLYETLLAEKGLSR